MLRGHPPGLLHTTPSELQTASTERTDMNIAIALRSDNAIVIYDEDDPRSGVVIDTVTQVANLIGELAAAATRLHGEKAWRWAQMRDLMQDDDD